MKILVCTAASDRLDGIVSELSENPEVTVVDVVNNGITALSALRTTDVDVSLASAELIDVSILVHRQALRQGYSTSAKRVIATPDPSPSILVKAHQFGFDDVIDVHDSAIVPRLRSLLDGNSNFRNAELFTTLSLRYSLLMRDIVVSSDDDLHIIDLMGVGLSDTEISGALGLTMQHVRNRIAELLHLNDLDRRTQLVALRNSHINLPDYVI